MRSLRGTWSLRRGNGEWTRRSRSQAELAAARSGEAVSCAALESRQFLSTVYAVTDNNLFLEFDSATPGTVTKALPITGLGDGEVMATIAFNPVTEQLYGIPSGSRTPVYTINRETGAATRVGPGVPFGFPLDKSTGLAFDELHGYFRYIDETYGNYRIDPETGLQLRNDAGQEGLAEIAYTPLNGDVTNFRFYGINHLTNQFMRLDPERMTVLSTGDLGVDTDRFVGLDIAADGTTYASLRVGGTQKFGTISAVDGHTFDEAGAVGNGAQYTIRGIAVEPRRQAPVLNAGLNPRLGAIDEDQTANVGTRVSELIQSVAPSVLITDPNPGALKGIAITGVDASVGTWEYSLNGGLNWSPVGSPDEGSALLLGEGDGTRVRLVPAAGFAGNVVSAIRFRAWDQSAGLQGQRLSVVTNGGSTAFSTDAVWASILVNDVSHPPTVTIPGGTLGLTDKATIAPLAGATIGYVDSATRTLSVDVTLMNPADGRLTDESLAAAGFVVVDATAGQYRFVGNAAAATAAIRQLIFKPNENLKPVGQQTVSLFRVNVDDGQGLTAQAFSPFIAAISLRDAPGLTNGDTDQAFDDKQTAQVFAQTSIFTLDVGAVSLTVDVTIPAGAGAFTSASLAASGFSLLGGAAGTYRFIGAAEAATAALRSLVFSPTQNAVAVGASWATKLRVSVSDGVGAAVETDSSNLTIRSANDAPAFGGLTLTNKVKFGKTIRPLRNLAIRDVDPGERVTVTIQLNAPRKGAFTAQTLRAAGFRKVANGKYTFTGTVAAANTRARKLQFAWAGSLNTGVNQTVVVKLTVKDAAGAQIVDNRTKVTLLR